MFCRKMRSVIVLAALLAVQVAAVTTTNKQSTKPQTTEPSTTTTGSRVQVTCSAVRTTERCGNNNEHIVIRVSYGDETLYHSCFDEKLMQVLYVNHALKPTAKQATSDNEKWKSEGFFSTLDPDKIYGFIHQQEVKVLSDYVISESEGKGKARLLTRGHLAAKGDFASASDKCTFYYINAAPQWNTFNSGNWNKLENGLRAYITKTKKNMDVYTGTFGVMQLLDKQQKPHDIYLLPNGKGGGHFPVPLYFYKVVYDVSREVGTAFVGINNPYYTKTEAEKLVFCKNSKCRVNDLTWLNIKKLQNVKLGYIFCCTVDELMKNIPGLPKIKPGLKLITV